jgi:mRNA-degrading endonuclease RelE of RelBE toxin-antitoxin system
MKPPVQINFSSRFRRDIKHLAKKYRHVNDDLRPLVTQLEQGLTPGDQVRGIGYTVYKVRIPNSDVEKGKSGGYGVIFYVQTDQAVVLATIYSKSERDDISDDELRRIIEDYLKK